MTEHNRPKPTLQAPGWRWKALPLFFALAALSLLVACRSAPQPVLGGGMLRADPTPSADWSADMARFAAEDATGDAASLPSARPVLFTGSSSVRLWETLTTDFPGVPVLNRGFGGSQVRDATWHLGLVALRYRPRQVLVYAGDNDIDAGRTPEQVLADVRALVAALRAELPDVLVGYLAIKPSPSRVEQLGRQQAANALVREWAATQEGVDFIDVATPMLDATGQPRAGLFLDDRLHLNADGYALWRGIVAPYLAGAR
ncbi:MAG: hypothetical protein KIS72_11725 [Luteimonas sp.]|nr:hypothetical protein [Luteimonas sp.]